MPLSESTDDQTETRRKKTTRPCKKCWRAEADARHSYPKRSRCRLSPRQSLTCVTWLAKARARPPEGCPLGDLLVYLAQSGLSGPQHSLWQTRGRREPGPGSTLLFAPAPRLPSPALAPRKSHVQIEELKTNSAAWTLKVSRGEKQQAWARRDTALLLQMSFCSCALR